MRDGGVGSTSFGARILSDARQGLTMNRIVLVDHRVTEATTCDVCNVVERRPAGFHGTALMLACQWRLTVGRGGLFQLVVLMMIGLIQIVFCQHYAVKVSQVVEMQMRFRRA
jgi:hypothetical protein